MVTITRGRPAQLRRAVEAVARQDYPFHIDHLVVVDDDAETYGPLEGEVAPASSDRTVSWEFISRRPGDRSGPPVLGRLRNYAARTARTPLVAFLDDDNLLEHHHFSSLLQCMRKTGCSAVHSQRRLVYADGTPYLIQLSPWKRDLAAAAARYDELRRHCVYVPWSNVIRDQVQPRELPHRIQMVDTSEWLFTRDQLLATPFGEHFSHDDWQQVIGEDNKLLAALVAGDVPVASTHMPTLTYVLGGLSNLHTRSPGEETWRPT